MRLRMSASTAPLDQRYWSFGRGFRPAQTIFYLSVPAVASTVPRGVAQP